MALSNVGYAWCMRYELVSICDACATVTSSIARMFNPLASPHYVVRSCNKNEMEFSLFILMLNGCRRREIKCAWKMCHCSPFPFGSVVGRRILDGKMCNSIMYFMRVTAHLLLSAVCVYALDSRRRTKHFDRSGSDGGDAIGQKRFFFSVCAARTVALYSWTFCIESWRAHYRQTQDQLRCIFDPKKW